MQKQSMSRFVRLFVVVFALAGLSLAQSLAGGSIGGTVKDASGAVVPGANLVAKNLANGATYTTTSNQVGLFVFPIVPVGAYQVSATKAGFATAALKNINVSVGAQLNLPITLSVASQTQQVTVTDEAPVVETTRTQVSSTVNDRSIKQLPVNGRNFIDFVLLTPGVTRDVRTGDISFAGLRGTLNSLTVDGADNNNTFFGQTTGRAGSGRAPYQFSEDAVQEFQVASNAYSAELGRAGGAVINVVTKSGTNKFHGEAFEFYRDQSLNANDPILKLKNSLNHVPTTTKPKYHFNQFGGNLGGPIVKDKLFFFFDFDGQRNAQPNVVAYVPPVIASPDQYEQKALSYLAARSGSYNRTLNQNTYLGKLDYNLNQRNQISARWNRQLFTGGSYENGGPTNSSEHTGDSVVHSDTVTVSATSTLSNRMVNQFRFTWLRDKEPGLANSILPEANVRQAGQLLLTVGRNFFSPRETTIKREQYGDTLTVLWGRHTLKFGGDVIVDHILNFFPGNFSGSYNFNSLEDFGRSLMGVAPLGTVTYTQAFAGTGTTGPTTHPDMTQPAFFVQDDFHVNSKLTLNLGFRYDAQLAKQSGVTNPAALAYGFNTAKIDILKDEWQPRFGFAYSPLDSNKLVVRGGYGIFYGNTPTIMLGTAMSNNGVNVSTFTYSGAIVPLYPNTLCGAPTNSPSCAPPVGGSSAPPTIFVVQPKFHNPIVQQANLSAEYQLTPNTSLTVAYLWVKGNHLQRSADQNLGTLTPATITDTVTGKTFTYLKYPSVRPYAGFSRIEEFQSNANSIYNGLTMQLNRRFARNFQGSVAYTWGHVIDDAPDATSVVPFSFGDDAKMVEYPTMPWLDRGNGVNDQRQRLVASGVWELKYGQNLPKLAKAVVSGWQLSGILSAQSGQPYSAIVNGDLNGDSNRATDRVPGVGRNTFVLPATWSFDPRILRNVNVYGDRLKVQLFAEAFNLFNHFNVTGVYNTQYALIGSTLKQQNPTTAPFTYFGLPNSAAGQRIVQLGAKIIF